MQIALIFPGQGAQKVGMGKEFYDSCPQARAVFDEADQILKNNLSKVIFEGPQEKLTSTAFCQPAILTFSIAALKAFQAHPKFQNVQVKYSAGLSLGEYSALVASGALSFADALRLVERRSFFMEEATQKFSGAMAAIIGFDRNRLQEICAQTGAQVANYNSPEQIVITGHREKVEAASRMIKEEGAKTVIPLEVSGAFHSSLMQPASNQFQKELQNFKVKDCLYIPVISNVTALPQTSDAEIRQNLGKQIVSSVRWDESIGYISGKGIINFLEVGPGKVLKGLLRKINPELKVFNIERPTDIESLAF